MLKPEQIPDAVIDVAVAMRDRGGSMSDIIRTALNAWPGMYINGWKDVRLPLTENKTDGPQAHEFVSDHYRPARCVDCGQRRDHALHQGETEGTNDRT